MDASIGSHRLVISQVTWIGVDGAKPSCYCEPRSSDEFIVDMPNLEQICETSPPGIPAQLAFKELAQFAGASVHDYQNCLL